MSPTMKAVVYCGAEGYKVLDRPRPTLQSATDAIVRMLHTTICGTDLHILRGHVASCAPGRILGHEGVGVIDSLGAGVTNLSVGDRVLISCISACGGCSPCRRGLASHCESGGWILGNEIDGTQAEYVRIPHAGFSLHKLAEGADGEVMVMVSDVFPTAYESGVLNAQVRDGDDVVIIGPGPIGLAALMMVKRLKGARKVVLVGRGQFRLDKARSLGADKVVSSLEINAQGGEEKWVSEVIGVDGWSGKGGFDAVIEAVGAAQPFELAQWLVAPGGRIASLGVFGEQGVLHLDRLWNRNMSLHTRLVDALTTPELLRMVEQGMLDPAVLISHRFSFDDIDKAYQVFQAATEHKSLKVIINF